MPILMLRRSASAQAGGVQSSLHDFWSVADNNKPKLPPDLWAKIAAYVVAHFFEEPIAVGESSDLYYPISLYYTRVKERENKENIQCISTTCKTFHDEVKKLLNMDHLVTLREMFTEVHCTVDRGGFPWIPVLKAPYYFAVFQKK